jgi:hypothetical protein
VILLAFALAAAAPQRPLPPDVRRFIDKRDTCEHWIGEEGYDAARQREINRNVRQSCTGVDRELDRLRRVYRHNPRVLAALKDYDKVNLQ